MSAKMPAQADGLVCPHCGVLHLLARSRANAWPILLWRVPQAVHRDRWHGHVAFQGTCCRSDCTAITCFAAARKAFPATRWPAC